MTGAKLGLGEKWAPEQKPTSLFRPNAQRESNRKPDQLPLLTRAKWMEGKCHRRAAGSEF